MKHKWYMKIDKKAKQISFNFLWIYYTYFKIKLKLLFK